MATMITSAQIRAARAILNWSCKELAKQSNISFTTIHNIENEKYAGNLKTLTKLKSTFENHDITFIGETGVDRTNKVIKILSGKKGFEEFFNDVYNTVKGRKKQTIRITSVDERKFIKNLEKGFLEQHVNRMSKLNNLKVLALTSTKYDTLRYKYASYKLLEERYFSSLPSYNYCNKLAYIIWNPLQVIIIEHNDLVDANSKQFDFIWSMLPRK